MWSLILLPPELSESVALLLILASFLTSGISAAFGLGGGVAMLVVLLSVTPPVVALPVHALVQIGSNAGRAWMLRGDILTGIVLWFIPGSVVGIAIASLVFVSIPVRTLQLLLSLFILWSIWAPGIAARPVVEKSYLVIGMVTSFATMFLGATGPLLAAFLSPTRYGKSRTVATHAACMSLQHAIKIAAFGLLGYVLLAWLPQVILMIISGFLGTALGRGLMLRIPEPLFVRAFQAVLTLLAARLLYLSLIS